MKTLKDLAFILEHLEEGEDLEMGFDMDRYYWERYKTKTSCKSACCIAGWLQHLNPHLRGQRNQTVIEACLPKKLKPNPEQIRDLHLPSNHSVYSVSAKKAAQAIRNFLKDCEPRWEEVMKTNN